jgi:DNA-binding CsgD family transcriptional regulator
MRPDAVWRQTLSHEAFVASQDQVERWLDQLSSCSVVLSTIAELKQAGVSNRQIAVELGLPIWAVKRKLNEIRLILTDLRRHAQ